VSLLQPETVTIGMDVGGSHVTVALHDGASGAPIEGTLRRQDVDAKADAETILTDWARPMIDVLRLVEKLRLLGIGIAMPGPFDYENGIALIRGLSKYDALHGLNIRKELKKRLGLPAKVPIVFRNDAGCFLLGEMRVGSMRGCRRAVGVTLGTGFGSGFAADGNLVESGDDVPPNGWLYECPFRGRTAEEWFSGRGLLELVHSQTPHHYQSVGDYAKAVRSGAESVAPLQHYGELMGEFLAPWIERFDADGLVIGGSISRSLDLFAASLQSALPDNLIVRASVLLEEAALIGAASLPLHLREPH
jgi:glucokinase